MADVNTEKNIKILEWKIKNLIKQLDSITGNKTSLITLVVPPMEHITRMKKLLADKYSTAANIKLNQGRDSVLEAITSVQQRLNLYSNIPANGLVIYLGSIYTEEGKEKKIDIHFEPYKPIKMFLYLCDNNFNTGPLRILLNNDDKYGFIVMDRYGAMYWSLQGHKAKVVYKFSVDLGNKVRESQSVVQLIRMHLDDRFDYIRKVCVEANRLFIVNNTVDVQGLVIASSVEFKNKVIFSTLLDQRLKSRILTTVDVSCGGLPGFNQAMDMAVSTINDLKCNQERRLIAKFFSSGERSVCYGVLETVQALEMGVVEILIAWEELDVVRYELKSRFEGTAIKLLTPEQIADRSNFCDEDGEEMEVIDSMLLLEWMVNNYQTYGASLEIIAGQSEEGNQFVKTCSGIAGLLRKIDELMDTSCLRDLINLT